MLVEWYCEFVRNYFELLLSISDQVEDRKALDATELIAALSWKTKLLIRHLHNDTAKKGLFLSMN